MKNIAIPAITRLINVTVDFFIALSSLDITALPKSMIPKIIKINGKETRVNDDYSKVSFSDKFVDWVTVVAKK